jgi:hypothetical protein
MNELINEMMRWNEDWEKEKLGNILFDVVSDTSKSHEQ